MTTALISRLGSGGAVVEINGVATIASDWRLAAAEADTCGIPWVLVDAPLIVLPQVTGLPEPPPPT